MNEPDKDNIYVELKHNITKDDLTLKQLTLLALTDWVIHELGVIIDSRNNRSWQIQHTTRLA